MISELSTTQPTKASGKSDVRIYPDNDPRRFSTSSESVITTRNDDAPDESEHLAGLVESDDWRSDADVPIEG